MPLPPSPSGRPPARLSHIDPEQYEKLLRQENAVWSRTHLDPNRARITAQDQAAAAVLGVNREKLYLGDFAKRRGIQWKMGLSLGCGEGRFERELIDGGFCQRFDAIDIAQESVAAGARIAAEKNRPIHYQVQDLNRCELPPATYDLVVAQTCLHHIIELEHLADQIYQTLRPEGYLWIDDFIGETRFQFSDERLRICNDLLKILPPELRLNRFRNKVVEVLTRPNPERLASPFEAIRSGEILDVFLERFEIVERQERNALLHLICPVGFRQNYVEHPNGRVVYDLLYYLDDLLIKSGILKPLHGRYIMRPRRQ